jgi:hypothetical protein
MQSRIFRVTLVFAAVVFCIGLTNGGSVLDRVIFATVLAAPILAISVALIWAMSPKS